MAVCSFEPFFFQLFFFFCNPAKHLKLVNFFFNFPLGVLFCCISIHVRNGFTHLKKSQLMEEHAHPSDCWTKWMLALSFVGIYGVASWWFLQSECSVFGDFFQSVLTTKMCLLILPVEEQQSECSALPNWAGCFSAAPHKSWLNWADGEE